MKISVAMCTYNGECFLAEQLYSILDQNVPVDEIVICDDGSTDKTLQIIDRFIQKNKAPIKCIRNSRNLGYTKNFEKAICLCAGDIILLADQDDIWMSNKVEIICNYFSENPDKEYVFSNAILINSMGTDCFERDLFNVVGLTRRDIKLFEDGCSYDVMAVSSKVTGATTALKASFIPYCLPFPNLGKLAIHDGMMSASASIWNKIGCIDQYLIKYRIHLDQSVGLGLLLRYPQEKREYLSNLLMWHKSLTDPSNDLQRKNMDFVYKRFLSIRSVYALPKLVFLFIRGDYRKYYSDHYKVFFRDMKTLSRRILNQIRRIGQLRLTYTNEM